MSIENCRIVGLPVRGDGRGTLSFVEGSVHIPFEIRRVYYLYDVPLGQERGAHAHKRLEQFIIPISGSFDVELDDGLHRRVFTLSHPAQALYVCPMIWRDLRNFSSNAVCLVLASERYDEQDYFRDYSEFKQAAAKSWQSAF